MDAKEIAETIIKNNAVYTWSDKTMQLAQAYLDLLKQQEGKVLVPQALEAKNAELAEALSSSHCPKPVCDNKTVGHCISSGNCGCDNKQALQENK